MKTFFYVRKASAIYLLIGVLFIHGLPIKAQNGYNLVGSARSTSTADCYQLTADRNTQNGAIWYDKLLHISESFEIEFTINLGANPKGADGVVMVLQTLGNRIIGTSASGIGYQGMTPSLGIEFDTYQNKNLGDPVADHIAIVRDGISNHTLNTAFASPVPISSSEDNVKDGKYHLVKVKWNARTRQISVYVDCVLRISQSVDLVNDIFKGRQDVYWGFTSATGASTNAHSVCLQKDIIARDTVSVCRLESLTLVSGLSANNQYEWKPTNGLSDPTIRTPQLIATSDQVYTVSYVDRCSLPKIDTINVKVKTPALSLGTDRQACEKEIVDILPTIAATNTPITYKWSTGDTTKTLKASQSGNYVLTINANGCAISDTVAITFNPLPKLGLTNEPTYDCPQAQTLLLDPQATGQNLSYSWSPGDSHGSTLEVSNSGRYTVKIKTGFGCEVDQNFTVLDNCIPDELLFLPTAFTPNGDGKNDVFSWTGSFGIDIRMIIFNRWGEVVFSTENSHEFWNGTCKGVECPANIYTWQIEYRSQQSKTNQWLVKYGEVLLVR